MARCLMFDLISTMIKTIESLHAGDEDSQFWARIEPVSRLTACRSLEGLQQEMKAILAEVCRHVRSRRTSHAEHLRQAIVAYIEQHCSERNLGPEAVADHVQRNSAYIARFFREQFGIGISGYIKNLRIAEAKRLIETTELTVRGDSRPHRLHRQQRPDPRLQGARGDYPGRVQGVVGRPRPVTRNPAQSATHLPDSISEPRHSTTKVPMLPFTGCRGGPENEPIQHFRRLS